MHKWSCAALIRIKSCYLHSLLWWKAYPKQAWTIYSSFSQNYVAHKEGLLTTKSVNLVYLFTNLLLPQVAFKETIIHRQNHEIIEYSNFLPMAPIEKGWQTPIMSSQQNTKEQGTRRLSWKRKGNHIVHKSVQV